MQGLFDVFTEHIDKTVLALLDVQYNKQVGQGQAETERERERVRKKKGDSEKDKEPTNAVGRQAKCSNC